MLAWTEPIVNYSQLNNSNVLACCAWSMGVIVNIMVWWEKFSLSYLLYGIWSIWRRYFILFQRGNTWKQHSQQTFVGLEDVFKKSSRHVLKTSSTRLQRNNLRLPGRFEDFLKTSWRHLARRLGRWKIVTLKTSWRLLEDMSWRRLEDIMKKSKIPTGDTCI